MAGSRRRNRAGRHPVRRCRGAAPCTHAPALHWLAPRQTHQPLPDHQTTLANYDVRLLGLQFIPLVRLPFAGVTDVTESITVGAPRFAALPHRIGLQRQLAKLHRSECGTGKGELHISGQYVPYHHASLRAVVTAAAGPPATQRFAISNSARACSMAGSLLSAQRTSPLMGSSIDTPISMSEYPTLNGIVEYTVRSTNPSR